MQVRDFVETSQMSKYKQTILAVVTNVYFIHVREKFVLHIHICNEVTNNPRIQKMLYLQTNKL